MTKKPGKEYWALAAALASALVIFLLGERIGKILGYALSILKPFVIGGAAAFVLNLPMKVIEKKVLFFLKGKGEKFRRPLSILLSLLFVALLVSILFVTVVPELVNAAKGILDGIPSFLEKTSLFLDKTLSPFLKENSSLLDTLEAEWKTISSNLMSLLKSGLTAILSSSISAAGVLAGGVTNAIVALIFAVYILGDKEGLARQLRKLRRAFLREDIDQKVDHVLSVMNRSFSSFITGQCLEAVILGTIFIIVLSVLRMPYAVMIGTVVMFSALLPIVGAFMACFFGFFLILISASFQKALLFVVVFLVVQQLENNLIYPKVVGASVGLPAIWVFVAVTLGGSLFGVVGMLFFIPLVSTLYSLLKESVSRRIEAKESKEIE